MREEWSDWRKYDTVMQQCNYLTNVHCGIIRSVSPNSFLYGRDRRAILRYRKMRCFRMRKEIFPRLVLDIIFYLLSSGWSGTVVCSRATKMKWIFIAGGVLVDHLTCAIQMVLNLTKIKKYIRLRISYVEASCNLNAAQRVDINNL